MNAPFRSPRAQTRRSAPDGQTEPALAVLSIDYRGLIVDVNDRFLDLSGHALNDIHGSPYTAVIAMRVLRYIALDLGLDVDDPAHGEPQPIPLITKAGDILWLYGTLTRGGTGEDATIRLAAHDFDMLGQRLITESGLIEAIDQQFLVAAFDMNGMLTRANPRFQKAFGFTGADVGMIDHGALVDADYAATREYTAFWNALRSGTRHCVQAMRYGRNGRQVWVDGAYHPIMDSRGLPVEVVFLARDLTLQKRTEAHASAQLRKSATIDALTGLANRATFLRSVQSAFNPVGGSVTGASLIMLIDIDGFSSINAAYGHEAGDAILWVVGTRLRDVLRGRDIVARINGDLFAAFVETPADERGGLGGFVERVQQAIAMPIAVGDLQITVTASVGLICDQGWRMAREAGADDIMVCAQAALAAAKVEGKASSRIYDTALADATRRSAVIERDLERALESGEICLHYQPVVALGGGAVVGYEALARWHHPALGDVAPPEFIDVAERNGMIHALGRRLLETAARFAATLAPDLWVAVNVSPIQLQRPKFASDALALIEGLGLSPDRIDIEITESASLDMSSAVQDNIRTMRAGGLKISLDDFGTGFSSLSQLLKLRADRIKIDRSFVMDCRDSQEKLGIIRSILGLSSAMGMKVVAEGIETPEISALLHELGCDYGQGYLFGRATLSPGT